MKNEMLQLIKSKVKNWWVSLIIGIMSLLLGVWCMITPLSTFLTLSLVFVLSFFIQGIFEIVFAITNRKTLDSWGWTLTIGIIDLIFGIILLANPLVIPLILTYFIGFWLMFQSFWSIGISIDLRKYENSGWIFLLIMSILSLLLSILLLTNPLITELITALSISAIFIIYGIFRIVLSFKLRSLYKKL